MLLLGVILLFYVSTNSAFEFCTREPWSTQHYWIDGDSNYNYFKVDDFGSGTDIKLKYYRVEQHTKYWFVTWFYRCGAGTLYMSSMVQRRFAGVRQYIYNDGTGPGVTLHPAGASLISLNTDGRIYYYHGGSSLAYASLGSKRNLPMKYVKRGADSDNLVFGTAERFWETVPYVTCSLKPDSISAKVKPSDTVLVSSLNGTLSHAAYVRDNSTLEMVQMDTVNLTQCEFRFEAIVYRLYKHINKKGKLIIRKAVVLRWGNLQQYISLNVTEDGEITLPYCYSSSISGSIHYNTVELTHYDDVARSNLSSFITADIEDQNVVDERFFEVIKMSGGTFQLVSTLHPDRYLAILDTGDQVKLVVTTKNSKLPDSLINYNFHMTNLGPKKVKKVRRLPKFSSCSLRPRKYYRCKRNTEG